MINHDAYSYTPRTQIKPLLEPNPGRVLELGCHGGDTLKWIKQTYRATATFGIDINPAVEPVLKANADGYAIAALTGYDGQYGTFDLMLFLDVLEHLVDPWQTLKSFVDHLSDTGTVIISVPNIRHYTILKQLIFQGRFSYDRGGIRDRTHLRFFTKTSLVEMVEGAGLHIDGVLASKGPITSPFFWLSRLCFGLFDGFFTIQYIVRTKKHPPQTKIKYFQRWCGFSGVED